ncbi:MAG: bifunctional UDP-N-acetylglucosamine diphosphorylase/glucosamine-1-phosphate N-acetyltransferase GlmU [Cycloclasticus sp.]
MTIKTIILAAGKGSRMKSKVPKVLHKLAGKPMLQWVVEAAKGLNSEVVVVYGHGGEQVKQSLPSFNISWVEQAEQLGTGHAVQQASGGITTDDTVLILYGDVPLINQSTLHKMIDACDEKTMSLLTVDLTEPTGYGRIVRSNGDVEKIVEQKDASDEQLLISEVNTGILALKGALLKNCLSALKNDNAQQEYYLTDVIEMAVNKGIRIDTIQPANEFEVQGVNSSSQLNQLERFQQSLYAEQLMQQGVTLADAARFDLRGDVVQLGTDIFIDCNVIFEGQIKLGSNVNIGANCVITNAVIEDNVSIKANSVLEDCFIGAGSDVGPFARIRPGTKLGSDTKVGNFVEIKKTNLGDGSKVSHLSYIGDAEIGKDVNIGAGTITCNYDGVNKYTTTIEDGAFIGSDTQLVAPVTVGKNATIAAGTTLTKNAAEGVLTLSRAKQMSLKNWKRPSKD